jgi:uncharacterized protein
MDQSLVLLTLGFFTIALIYASVGFGGGSSYLALLALPLFQLLPDVIRPTALLCNIIVVTGGTIIFYRQQKIVWKEVWPFLAVSVPFAYLGGFWKLEHHTFFLVLSVTLLVASIFLWIQPDQLNSPTKNYNSRGINIALGSSIGFLSGLVSIGGGIFLSPILHFIRWSEARKISALASLFILVNSISGLAGQYQRGFPPIELSFLVPLLLAVFIGGQIGSRLGAQRFNPIYIRRITALLIFVAGIFIFIKHV